MGSLAAKVSSPLQQCWPVRTTTPLEAPGAVTLDLKQAIPAGGDPPSVPHGVTRARSDLVGPDRCSEL